MESQSLVDIAEAFPQSAIDLKYATADNLTGKPIYRDARCLLHVDAAKALAKCINIAGVAGYKMLSSMHIGHLLRRLFYGRPVRILTMLCRFRVDQTTVAERR